MAPQWRELPHRDAVSCYDEALAFVELAHDFSALVAQLPLRDLSCHVRIVARRATPRGLSPSWSNCLRRGHVPLSGVGACGPRPAFR